MANSILKKIEIVLFVFCLFFQNFAIIKTSSFGISALCLFLIYIFFKDKYYKKIDKKQIEFTAVLLVFIMLSSMFNGMINIMQIIRILMIVFIVFATYNNIKDIFKNNHEDLFIKIFVIFSLIITIYGLYQFIAVKFNLPLFLNIFNNNPSYGARGIFEDYSGWSNTSRIYTVFFEPSVYAIFMTNALFFVNTYYRPQNKKKYFVLLLILVNIILTFARSGWMILISFVFIYFIYRLIKNKKILIEVFDWTIINLPFICFLLMIILGLKIFNDLSSLGRTYSSIYYFTRTFENIKTIIIGHGYGSLMLNNNVIINNVAIENFAHNGYIEILYQLGWGFLVYLVLFIKKMINENVSKRKWLVYASIFTLCCFGALYSVESLISLVSIIYAFCKFSKNKKENIV